MLGEQTEASSRGIGDDEVLREQGESDGIVVDMDGLDGGGGGGEEAEVEQHAHGIVMVDVEAPSTCRRPSTTSIEISALSMSIPISTDAAPVAIKAAEENVNSALSGVASAPLPASSSNGQRHPKVPVAPTVETVANARYLQRMVMDQSISTGLLDHMFSDSSLFEVMGYIGGSVRRVPDLSLPPMQYSYYPPGSTTAAIALVPGEVVLTYVTHYWPCERSLDGILLGELVEKQKSYHDALLYFKEQNVECVGWYRSNNPMKQPIPSKMDVSKQTQMQRLHPCSLGIILSLTSSNRPSRFFPESLNPLFGSPLVSPIHSLTAFRAYSEMVASDTGETVLTSAAEEVLIAIYEQSFAGPGLIKSSVATLPISLKESIEAYEMVSHDLLPASHGKRSLDSEFEGFLHSFWKGGVLDAAEAIDQNFAKLSQAKVLVSSWISNKIGSLQNAFNTSLSGSAEEGGIPQFDDVLSELCQRQTDRAMDPLGQTLSRLVTSLSSPLGFYPSTITVNGQSSHTPAPSMNAYNMGSQTPYADPTVSPQALSAKRVRRTRKDKGEKRKRRNSEFDAQEVTHGPVLPDAKEAEEQEILKTAAEEVSRVELKSDVITDLMVKTANAVNSMLDERERTTTLNIERFAVAMSV